ncbi:Holliday junction branch migration protein RuvA [Candidatus Uhrbacteria bacterium]|jgi:holliday junction DNA helicase RuvA|nr:Holliday junction branch migration protein RuvA [Candidatus Uhrbacteria bacterium]
MIAFLEGNVQNVGVDSIVLRVGGIGYSVYYTDANPVAGEVLSLHIYDYIREDRHELFGFVDEGMRTLFEKMIDISGIGPKMAQKILRAAPRAQLHTHIEKGDVAFLTQVPGVGKKTAQKIILELQGVLVTTQEETSSDYETVDALMSLGYGRQDAQLVVAELTAETTDDRIREALKLLGS